MSRNPIYIKLINSQRWRQLRAKKLQTNPICEECEKKEKSTLATEVHHIIPVESVSSPVEMFRLMFSYSNLESVCYPCHKEIHRIAFSHSKEAVQENNRRQTERFVEKFLG